MAPSVSHSVIPADKPITTAPTKETAQHGGPMAISEQVLGTVRCLGVDLVQQYNGGHPGTVMGAAAIALALWGGENTMRYNPADAEWIDRDRFVLSAGHASLLQYIFLHLTGYKTWTMDQLKRYHSRDFHHAQAAGHPEIDFEGIEVTTGPLGQGIANAVGLAMASKHLSSKFNVDSFEVVKNKVWCMTGDGCLQEGVGQEALSLAGHLRLDNLIIVYDNNGVTIDGKIDTCFTENTSAKLIALGWRVIDVGHDATNDPVAIQKAMQDARASTAGKPVFINIRTTIGFGSQSAGLPVAHGTALGDADVEWVKMAHRQDPSQKYVVGEKVYEPFKPIKARGMRLQRQWGEMFQSYKAAHPALASEFEERFNGLLDVDCTTLLPEKKDLPQEAIATRKASGIVISKLGPALPQLMAGSADLMDSTFVAWSKDPAMTFQSPYLFGSGEGGSFTGRQIRYGIREHAMAAIANGLAAYHPNAILPVVSTFFMFFLYAAPAVRMAALQRLRVLSIATHDGIGIGEDGPTHHPIALASLSRAMPGINFLRPADAEEVMGAWMVALDANSMPSMLSLSRQVLPLLKGTSREGVARGAYPIFQSVYGSAPDLVFIATGSEVHLAVEVASLLASDACITRVVSMPSQAMFDRQPSEYKEEVLPTARALIVAIEAWSSYGWARYAHASVSMHSFGLSAPADLLYEHFGFAPKNISTRVLNFLQSHTKGGVIVPPAVGKFEELLL